MTPPSLQPSMTGMQAFHEAVRLDSIGRFADAQKLCAQLLKAAPNHPDVQHLMGVIYFHGGKLEDAARHLKQALKLKPDMTEAASNLAKVYYRKGKWRELLATLETIRDRAPDRLGVLTDIGFAHEQLGDVEAALASYHAALALDPAAPLAHANIGAILTKRGSVAAARDHLTRALAAPRPPEAAFLNMAVLLDREGRKTDVIGMYDDLLARAPDHVLAHFQRAMALLSQERFAEGWAEYAWRFRRPDSQTLHAAFTCPLWRGEALAGRKVLVWTEQGPGDEILLASMLPDVIAAGAELILVCSPRLLSLFRRSFPAADVVSNVRIKPTACDLQASFSDLGAVLRPTRETFPARARTLVADEARRARLRETYQRAKPGTKLVGIAWHSANAAAESHKSIGLEAWVPILRQPNATFVSLQYGDHRNEIAAVRAAFGCEIIHDPGINALTSIDDFAAQAAAMDHVVSVSNTTVHVAGALGIPTLVLVPKAFGRMWYWFQGREDSPWYPSLRLIRQQDDDAWDAPLAAAAAELTRWLESAT